MLCCCNECRVRQNSVLNPAVVYSEKRTRSKLNKVSQDNFVYVAVPDRNILLCISHVSRLVCYSAKVPLRRGAPQRALQLKRCSCTQLIKSCIFYYKSCENLYQVLQVTCAVS